MLAVDNCLKLYQQLDFGLPQNSQDDIACLKNNWFVDLQHIKQLIQSDSDEYAAFIELTRQNTEESPQKIALSALDYDIAHKKIDVIDTASIVGFYAHPFISAQHFFQPKYNLISLAGPENKIYHQEVAQVIFPQLLSQKQINWLGAMGLSVNKPEHTLSLDSYLYLKQKNYISSSVGSHRIIKYNSPYPLGLAGLFGIEDNLDDDSLSFEQDEVNIYSPKSLYDHKRASVYNALIEFLTTEELSNISQASTKDTFLRLEKKVNLSLLSKIEQFRAYACLIAAQQNIHMAHEPYGVYRGVMQMRGLQPYFYLTLDNAGFAVSEKLLQMGYTPHPKLLPAYTKTLNMLKADGKLSAYAGNHLHFISGVIGETATNAQRITNSLIKTHIDTTKDKQNV